MARCWETVTAKLWSSTEMNFHKRHIFLLLWMICSRSSSLALACLTGAAFFCSRFMPSKCCRYSLYFPFAAYEADAMCFCLRSSNCATSFSFAYSTSESCCYNYYRVEPSGGSPNRSSWSVAMVVRNAATVSPCAWRCSSILRCKSMIISVRDLTVSCARSNCRFASSISCLSCSFARSSKRTILLLSVLIWFS